MRNVFATILAVTVITATAEAGQPAAPSFGDLLRHYSRQGLTFRQHGKCGLWEAAALVEMWPGLSKDQQRLLAPFLAIPQTQRDRVIGHFHFYYDTSGANAPALLDASFSPIPGTTEQFIDSAGAIFNAVWNVEIGSYGYPAPPLAGDQTYPVAVQNLGNGGIYGETVPDQTPIANGPPPRYSTHIEIDNTFRYIYPPSRGLPALRVTAAHEFHHAIQIGVYGFWGLSESYFYELTSTWMEDEVYPEVNDYLQYLTNDPTQSSQFSHPEVRFTKSDRSIEYSRALWGKYMAKRFSRSLMRECWETIGGGAQTLFALGTVLQNHGSSLGQAIQEYAYWNLNTGPQADTARFYPDGQLYPVMRVDTATYFPPQISVSNQVAPFGSWYTKFCIHRTVSDTTACLSAQNIMTAIVTNENLSSAYSDMQYAYSYILQESASPSARRLSNGLYAELSVPDPQNWGVEETVPTVVAELTVFPNPYPSDPGHGLWFRFPSTPRAGNARLQIFSADLRQVFAGSLPVLQFRPGEPAIRWDGLMNNGHRVGSGIFIYDLTIDNEHHTGKFASIRQ